MLFLFGAAIGLFFLRRTWEVGVAAGALAAIAVAVGLSARRVVRQVTKLWGFALFIAISYGFFAGDPDFDRWVALPAVLGGISINAGGLEEGAAMFLRVLAVILASQIARAGDARAVAAGLRKLGVPEVVSASIDTVLALLGGGGGGGSGGGGGGGGRHRRGEDGDAEATPEKGRFWASVRRMAKGDVAPIFERLERQIARAERHAESARGDAAERGRARDVAVIAGISLTMLGIKALKILPSIPFAPGHKLVLLTPLYIAASRMTKSRFGATLTGATMGTVAFLLGDGKYGIFEILKHIAPGLVADLFVPILCRRDKRPGGLVWSLFGGLIAVARFATIFAVVFLVQAPAVAWAILIPGLTVHVTFGIASGYVTYHIVRAIDRPGPDPPDGRPVAASALEGPRLSARIE